MQVGSGAAAATHQGVRLRGNGVGIDESSGAAAGTHRGVGLHSHPVGEDNAGGTGEAVPLSIVVAVCECECAA